MTKRKLSWLLVAILSVAAAIFAAQNDEMVDYRFLNWVVQIRRSIVVVACIAIGVVIGWIIGASRRRR